MRNRALKRHAARQKQSIRRGLVHAAGCTEPRCVSKLWIYDVDIADSRNKPTGSVPRSLRGLLGRYL